LPPTGLPAQNFGIVKHQQIDQKSALFSSLLVARADEVIE
jgi:hypothetical protein